MERTSVQLYRDCLRMVKHIGGNSSKGLALRKIVRVNFRKNIGERDERKIEALKADAIRALSNYLVMKTLK